MKNSSFAVCTALVLSACGGSDDSGLPTQPFLAPAVSAGDIELPAGPAGYITLAEETIDVLTNIPNVIVTQLPGSNSANFNGILTVSPELTDDGYIGDFVANVNFAAQTLTGTGSGFFYDDGVTTPSVGVPVTGTIFIDETQFLTGIIEIEANGTLDGTNVSGDGTAVLLGQNGGYLFGSLDAVLSGVIDEDAEIFIFAD